MQFKLGLTRQVVAGLLLCGISLANEQLPMTGGKQAVDPYIAKQVKNTIFKKAKSIQECWLPFLAKNPVIEKIKIEIDWQIRKDGRVEAPEVVKSETADKAFHSCLTKKIKALRFPPHDAAVPKYIAHKFTFEKEKK